MKNKKILIVVLGVIVGIVLGSGNVEAALQSNGNSVATKNLQSWIVEVRQMETAGGTLGLSDTINESSLVSDGEPNNLDIHMEKNTEYGAMAILSASSYGNPSKINSGETTTGNKSGIYININKEWVSAGDLSDYGHGKVIPRYRSAHAKYKNSYNRTYVARNGDAITETNNWHGSNSTVWIKDAYSGLIRAYSGSLFSYNGDGGFYGLGATSGPAAYTYGYASRACIVVGQGF